MRHLPLLSTDKKLASEFHPFKNAPSTPDDFTLGSNEKVWWLCKKDKSHDWDVSVNDRYQYKSECPICRGKKVHQSNCLSTTHPDLALEWHPIKNNNLTPEMFTRGAHQVVWWLCKNDKSHEWPASINSRTNIRESGKATGCPLCSSKISLLELRLYSELKSVFCEAEQRKRINRIECDIYLPLIKVAVEVDGSFWHKSKYDADKRKNDELDKMGIKVIRIRGNGLKKINRLDVIHNFNKNPFHLIKRILLIISKLRKIDKAINIRINEYIKSKAFRNERCFKQLLNMLPWAMPGSRLSEIRPDVAEEWHPTENGKLTADMVSVGSSFSAVWICRNNPNHIWRAKVIDRTLKNSKCRYCSGREASPEYNLTVTDPDIAKQWHFKLNKPWSPEMVTRGSHKIFFWRCERHRSHVWRTTVNKRTSNRGCPYCANKIAWKDNCLATKFPGIAQEWHPLKNIPFTPKNVTYGSGLEVWWQCPIYKTHNWKVNVNNRTAYKTGCRYCLRKRADKRNCLAVINPKLAKEWHPTKNGKLTPNHITTQSIKRVYWLCHKDKNHNWKLTVNQRKWSNVCPQCSMGD